MCILVHCIFPPQGQKSCSGIKQTSKALLACLTIIKTCALYALTHLFDFTLLLNREICPTLPVILTEFWTRKKSNYYQLNLQIRNVYTSTHEQLSSKFLPSSVNRTAFLGSNQKHLFAHGFDNYNLKTNSMQSLWSYRLLTELTVLGQN